MTVTNRPNGRFSKSQKVPHRRSRLSDPQRGDRKHEWKNIHFFRESHCTVEEGDIGASEDDSLRLLTRRAAIINDVAKRWKSVPFEGDVIEAR